MQQDLLRWMRLYIAVLLDEPVEGISVDDPISTFDLDSIDIMTFLVEMEENFEKRFNPEILFNGDISLSEIAANFSK